MLLESLESVFLGMRGEEGTISTGSSINDKVLAVHNLKASLKCTNITNLLTSTYDDDSKSKEKKVYDAVSRAMKVGLSDRENREAIAAWFAFVGLTPHNIRHLEICSITDFTTLFSYSVAELRSLADRGRFDVETKRKLLQSTVILHNHCQVSNKRDSTEDTPGTSSNTTPNTASSIPGLTVNNVKMFQSTSMNFANAPKSPKTSSRMVHAIPHKWHRSTKFRFTGDAVCHFCQRPLGFGFRNAWEKCRSCKWKVHSSCKTKVGDSCGLTPDHLRFLFDKLIQENNGGMWKDPQSVPGSRSMNEPAFQFPDTAIDSSSSTNSSAPSTPAIPLGVTGSLNPLTAPYRSERKFLFPDSESYSPHNKLPILVISEGDSILETRGDGNIESEGTVVAHDSVGSTSNENQETANKFNKRADGGFTWERHTWNMSTIRGPNAQASWNEVTIQLDSIEFDKAPLIGHGRFGQVLRGFHYGDVAVKLFSMDHIAEKSKRAEEFKVEVSAYKNTRHDNIALFLGYFMSEDKFGIVTSLCRGSQSLYALIRTERLDLVSTRRIAQQICQGVSYLHTKKILHKDLRTKNILIENKNKIVVTDFGIMSMKRIAYPKREKGYVAPEHWCRYMSPELIMGIKCEYDDNDEDLPFSEYSDVYAFGTLWFEMLTGKMPFPKSHPHQIIYDKSIGLNSTIPNINCTREMKEILTLCWTHNPNDRPTFSDINAKLSSLPKKQRINRSPSFPVMMKSYESTF